ncbi:putative biotin-requiring enzyme [Lyophyllum shimeji]|uniref:Biotin-requiring enzyme n=1 Tax=Lyophyllum shimeji TaxID=47721 RepID=A0A9P3PHF8_LYOSH|nr:putative biotin-requiring enzyme [Lyophyllum shimeji]
MTTLALNSLSRSSARNPLLSAGTKSPQAGPQFRKRWFHQTLSRQAIMMPAMSPFMTAGTITRWTKKEGDAFVPGDVLLQIESDIAMVDVEAESAGILGKILLPDGTKNVPVEQVIALVINPSDRGLKNLSSGASTPPPYNPISSPPSRAITSPARAEAFSQPFFPPAHRSPTFADVQHSHQHHRGMTMRHARRPKLTIVPPSPRITVALPIRSSSSASVYTETASVVQPENDMDFKDSPVDGATIRRMILSRLSRTPSSAVPLSASSNTKCDASNYFDGVL